MDLKIFSYITKDNFDNQFRCSVFKAYRKVSYQLLSTFSLYLHLAELMKVVKQEFSKLFNYRAPVKRDQELHESWQVLPGYYRARSENFHQLSSKFKRAQSWLKLMRISTRKWQLSTTRILLWPGLNLNIDLTKLTKLSFWSFSTVQSVIHGTDDWSGIRGLPSFAARNNRGR